MIKMRSLYVWSCVFIMGAIGHTHGVTPPSVTISGRGNFSLYGVGQKIRQDRSRGYHTTVQGAQINVSVDRASDSGIQHKLMFSLNGTPSIPMGPNPPIFQQAYAELKGRIGTFQAGNVFSVPETMVITGGSVLRGNFGYDGYLGAVFNSSAKVVTGTNMIGNVGAATKFAYYTPRFGIAGMKPVFQVGMDFTPNSEHRGDAILSSNRTQAPYSQGTIFGNNILGFGVNYMDDFDPFQIQVAFCGLRGRAMDGRYTLHIGDFANGNRANRYNLRPYNSWEIGALVGMNDTQFAVGYVNDGKSATQRVGVTVDPTDESIEKFAYGKAPRLFNIGLSHRYGPAVFSVGHQHNTQKITKIDKTKCRVVSMQCEYDISEGVSSFMDANLIRHNTTAAAQDLNAYEGGRFANRLTGYDFLDLPTNKGFVASTGFKVFF
jgi:hypothetical protein